MKKIFFFSFFLLIFIIAGCQNSTDNNRPSSLENSNQNIPAPYSNGPSSSPQDSLKGPTAPPPKTEAVTEKVEGSFSLQKE